MKNTKHQPEEVIIMNNQIDKRDFVYGALFFLGLTVLCVATNFAFECDSNGNRYYAYNRALLQSA